MKSSTIALAGIACSCSIASAQLIGGVTATSSLPDAFGTSLTNTLNGMGLPGNVPSLHGDHEPTSPANSWVTDASLPGTITFNLNGSYSVQGFSFWNQNDGGPGAAGTTGLNDVAIEFSTNGIAYNVIPGAPTNFAAVATGISPPEIFAFSPVTATHIRINVRSNHGDLFTGFGEIQFNQVPAPTTLTALAIGGLLCTRRRRAH